MKRKLEISLEKARELYSNSSKDIQELLLQSFTKEELEVKEVKSWEDLGIINGFYISDDSEINICSGLISEYRNMNTWATKEQAKAALAMSQLSQLMKHYNGDWKPNWKSGANKFIICFYNNKITTDTGYGLSKFLAFPTAEIRDRFLENHRNLIEQAKPLL